MAYFEQTCNKLYDRHQYKITFSNGREQLFSDYDTMRNFWFTHSQMSKMIVSVVDAKKPTIGFA